MTAMDLARVRALAAAPVTDVAALSAAAADVGRQPARAGLDAVLARHLDASAPAELDIGTASLPNSALVALGLCIGLAWYERDRHPYPGQPIQLEDLTRAARSMGIEASATRHLVGAVRHVLARSRLLDVEGDVIRLGPTLAGWSETDLEALRRNIDVLPASGELAS